MRVKISDEQNLLMKNIASGISFPSHNKSVVHREGGFSRDYTPLPEHKKSVEFSANDFKNNVSMSVIYHQQDDKQTHKS